jgi:RNA polymerase sigma-70 factor (ECF subfamily)
VAYTGHVNATTTWVERRGVRVDAVSFESAAAAHLDDVYAYLLYLTGDPSVAEDLTGETFEKALRRWRRFDPARGSAKTWLCQLARSSALDHMRSERRRRRREEAFAPEDRHEQRFVSALSPALEQALLALSAAEREVIALRVILDLDGESAARLLGISPTACSTRLSRALKKLEEMVSDVEL